ncbi:DUF5131 family protein [Umezawaea tangerina]|uniref:Protein gp37 n=1 Tax=Umezawaea tangerina TaxID=84725 RepID=A0A2T0SPF5_9PSEU|nr:phage Gp37/Gp68 family protein [Umezawaea tangerina]PRY35290.1 protein gp37 [Umezawaea tangerina]
MADTTISWTDKTWNPVTGCDRVSAGCDNCYALGLAKRLKGMELQRIAAGKLDPAKAKYQTDGDPRTSGPGFGVAMHEAALTTPLGWRHPQKVFVNSMSDLFHTKIEDTFIAKVFATMLATPRHTYQVLTKRPPRMRALLRQEWFWLAVVEEARQLVGPLMAFEELGTDGPGSGWFLSNVWLGTSAEDQRSADIRVPALLGTPAAVRYLSCEPLIGPIDLAGPVVNGHRPKLTYWLTGRPSWGPAEQEPSGVELRPLTLGPRIDWVIAGGESGPGARPMHPAWARSLRDQCADADVAFHFKQWGEWAPTEVAATERSAANALYIERDGATRPAARGARSDAVTVQRTGTKTTGRRLDGRVHDAFPSEVTR